MDQHSTYTANPQALLKEALDAIVMASRYVISVSECKQWQEHELRNAWDDTDALTEVYHKVKSYLDSNPPTSTPGAPVVSVHPIKAAMNATYGPTWDKAREMWNRGASMAQIGKAIGRSEASTVALITSRRKVEGAGMWPYRSYGSRGERKAA